MVLDPVPQHVLGPSELDRGCGAPVRILLPRLELDALAYAAGFTGHGAIVTDAGDVPTLTHNDVLTTSPVD